MAKDEEIDGPAIVAAILSRLTDERREQIMHSIQSSNPEIATKISASLINFDELQQVTPQGLQLLLKEVPEQDLVISLKKASSETREAIMTNLSERRQKIVIDELQSLPPTPVREVEKAQRRILEKLEELRTNGAIRTKAKSGIWV